MELAAILSLVSENVLYVIAVILALSIIVTIHEYGHYIVGKWSGIKADVFSIGFGKPLYQRTGKDGTVWQIASLPLGGYVKFAGDANAASAPDAHAVDGMAPDEARHTMPGAPLWARTATVAAGPIFNFAFTAILITLMVLFYGQATDKLILDEIKPSPYENNLQQGDEVLSIAGMLVSAPDERGDFIENLPREAMLEYTVLRGTEEISVTAPHPFQVIVGLVTPKSAARDARLEIGDVITHVDGIAHPTFYEFRDFVNGGKDTERTLTVWRDGETFETLLTPRRRDLPKEGGGFEERWLIGFNGALLFSSATEPVGLGDAVLAGIKSVGSIISQSLSSLYNMIVGKISTCNLSGAIGMAGAVSTMASQGLDKYIEMIAVISTAIGLINLFPIPVLDGGHLVFYAYEAIRGKPLPERAVGIMMRVGLTLILSLMLLGLGADIFCV